MPFNGRAALPSRGPDIPVGNHTNSPFAHQSGVRSLSPLADGFAQVATETGQTFTVAVPCEHWAVRGFDGQLMCRFDCTNPDRKRFIRKEQDDDDE